ncbi:MAG: hypothetical protein CME70_18855 [Halobacteriovorax sp.]|nr:hypothetical protein [Halobacteriovorax sp.]
MEIKVGDLVKPSCIGGAYPEINETWIGIVIGWDLRGDSADPVVMWNDRFPSEVEYKEQLEVINESR